MRNLIYQFWNGRLPYYANASRQVIEEYAKNIGAEYRCDINEPFFKGPNSNYLNCLRPVYDREFDAYDKVLFLDMDIFTVKDVTDNIFDVPVDGIGMVQEILQPSLREKSPSAINTRNDKEWANLLEKKWDIVVPRDTKNRPLVYNSGVVLYTREARVAARKNWLTYEAYHKSTNRFNKFYQLDQNYLGAVAFSGITPFTELDLKWNAQVHYTGDNRPRSVIDNRKKGTVFVHIQTRPRDILDDTMIYDIVNRPVQDWRHRND